jgi:predicted site-specific integrase-resolvase
MFLEQENELSAVNDTEAKEELTRQHKAKDWWISYELQQVNADLAKDMRMHQENLNELQNLMAKIAESNEQIQKRSRIVRLLNAVLREN